MIISYSKEKPKTHDKEGFESLGLQTLCETKTLNEKPYRWPEGEKEKIYDRNQSGETLASLAREYNRSPETIRVICVKEGKRRRQSKLPQS